MRVLRVALPPLNALSLDTPLEIVRAGGVEYRSLAQLAISDKGMALVCFLHADDSLLTSIALPALSKAKLNAAVNCAVQSLILGDIEQLYIAHSPRDAAGQVHLGWLPRTALDHLAQLLERLPLKIQGLYPAPYGLALSIDDEPTRSRLGDYVLLRHTLEHAQISPLLDDTPTLLAAQRCGGPLPSWGLHAGLTQRAETATGWGWTAACVVLTLMVWILGLNVYARAVAREGMQLKVQMAQRVKQVFPQIPVVLNPLQQAQQQLDAATNTPPPSDFIRLIQKTADALPYLAGNVQSLTYGKRELRIGLRADAPKIVDDAAWKDVLAKAGIQASQDANHWTLQMAEPEKSDHGD
ncbi:type II secretion system protein GspL [Pseudomonas sp. ITA]|uniref:type II secretion system protein GspL n=1 Tax=Pseudomonas sp. ITA TaxID=2825841 RepID=UPI0024993DFD|nr:type II secretion system protein GspL [Pseudomonas sp. ITA]MDI2146182.1 type II secretion system protein GspL [Pseudomonas sp. ITA]